MLPCLALLLLAGLSKGATAGHSGEELVPSPKARPWVTVTLEVAVPSIQLQLQEAKRFFGLMGKRVGGVPRIRPGLAGHQLGEGEQGLLGRGGLSTEDSRNVSGSHQREGSRQNSPNCQPPTAPSPGTEDEDPGSE